MKDYHVNVFYSDEDGGYIADIPDLEFCSAFGETPADALQEVEKAKNYLALQLLRNFETTERIAASLAQMFIYTLPQDYSATYMQRVRAVTPADVQRVAGRYIQPDKFAVVVVGDRKVIEPGIKSLNLADKAA